MIAMAWHVTRLLRGLFNEHARPGRLLHHGERHGILSGAFARKRPRAWATAYVACRTELY
jgi:hypothetical protein